MGYKNEIKPSLVFTNGETTQAFHEGDAVICRTGNGRRYIGKIATIGRYQESAEAESENVICLHTFKDRTSYSGEIIKAADIEYMCKCPLGDLLESSQIDEMPDRDSFISMFVGLGYDKPKSEIIYESMKDFKDIYNNIPLSSVLANILQEVNLNVDGDKQDELVGISSMLMSVIGTMFQSITEVIREKQNEWITSQSRHVDACAGGKGYNM